MSHIVGSTSFVMHVVNSIVAGSLGAVIANAAGASPGLIAVVGTAAGLGHMGLAVYVAQRTFATPKLPARFPTAPDEPS